MATKSIYGLAADTQVCFVLATLSRCMWSLDTRLVETKLAYLELFLSTSVAIILGLLVIRYRHTTTKKPATLLRYFVIVPVALVLAFFVHPGHHWWTVQILVAFTMYVEAGALIPQLYLMRKMIEIEPLTSHYVAMLVLSRVVRMLFWVQLYYQGEHFVGLFLADLVHTLLSVDYLYLWCRKLRHGGSLIYRV
uniref:ER lumen protein-retaining receptor n=1 Tax=Chromera velia CCMP2878 TaxID=1169474 RepID=A0A0G4G723_9ALVE|eukprot:Cvel_20573.t1-p1 / transcript=Cvel_20573.t1 / gene=Cvel_20573 / organism=Chromera_velia_CCMP2878 / gene_product=ER lumen protein retaining receptor, putative / transcript_product=ER lumen protein retaining receptor, putative / location=Cvel_scaffold1858:22940-24596(+) / protein_length=192 / sequence_SO=supercontig / SO=protein_coding / is_pseudo=false